MEIIFFPYIIGIQSPKYISEYQIIMESFSSNSWQERDNLPNNIRKSIELYYKRLFGTTPYWESSFINNLYEINNFLDFHFENFKIKHPEKVNLFLNHTESITETFNQCREVQHQRGINKIKDIVINWVNSKREEIEGHTQNREKVTDTNPSAILVPSNYQKKVINALCPYIEGDRQEIEILLKKVLSGEVLTKKILFNGSSKKLAYFLKALIAKKVIIKTQEEVIQWLIQNFEYKNHRTKKWQGLSYSNLRNDMAKGAKPPHTIIPIDDIL